ncbi:MAG: family 43 glycosylhydrolase [Sedimentisphaerales bacterium]
MKNILILLAIIMVCLQSGSQAADVNSGQFFKIYDASNSETDKWYINDHCFIRDANGLWHLFGITDREPLNPASHTINLAHATARELTQSPWAKQPYALTADANAGEQHLWAPHIILHDGTYYMFYCAGSLKTNSKYRIHLATSTDLKNWKRHPANPMVVDGYDARDPYILKIGDEWIMYYTVTSTPKGGNHIVACLKSKDLIHWGQRRVVFTDPSVGTFGGPTESPQVIRRGEYYYLFIGPRDEKGCVDSYRNTTVFRSKDPFKWTIEDRVGQLTAHAVEVVRDVDGQWYVSHCGWGQGGVYLAKLYWNDGLDDADTSMLVPAENFPPPAPKTH